MKRFFPIGLLVGLLAVAVVCGVCWPRASVAEPGPAPAPDQPKTFTSYEELTAYIEHQASLADRFGYYRYGTSLRAANGLADTVTQEAAADTAKAAPAAGAPAGNDYSATNIQVQGVDEADVVKTDGRYLYVLNRDQVSILAAYPAANARVLSRIDFPGTPQEAFIVGDRLAVFGVAGETGASLLHIYDVTDRAKPVLKRTVSSPGCYLTSRLIGEHAYVILNEPVVWKHGVQGPFLPRISVDGQERAIAPDRIHYFDVSDRAYQYTMVLAINTQDDMAEVVEKTFLTGTSQNIFASLQHIYLTGPKTPDPAPYVAQFFDHLLPVLPEDLRLAITEVRDSGADVASKMDRTESLIDQYLNRLDVAAAKALEEKVRTAYRQWQEAIAPILARERNKTVICKLAVDGDAVTYRGKGEVPGRVLNQFSMDEYQGYFRIATTSEGFSFDGSWINRNNVYVLDENLQTVGRLEGLAAGERIYAARFMGDRCYLVTFREVDPLFAIDLTDPAQPRTLGELKIPGYSNYLHPYDEHHLLGIGKEVVDGREAGLKIALFDVSDPTHPKEKAKYVIGGGTVESPALHDHKAVLFSRDKNLLALPVSTYPLYRIMDARVHIWPPKPVQGWQGAYVFTISPDGISLKGKVEHQTAASGDGFAPDAQVKRCLYIEDVLYTVSDEMVKMNRLSDLRAIKEVRL